MKKILFVTLILVAGELFGQMYYQPGNLDFESGFRGNIAPNWVLPRQYLREGFEAYLIDDNVAEGRYALAIENTNQPDESLIAIKDSLKIGAVFQTVDASNYRAKEIKVSAKVRTELIGDSSTAHFVLQIRYDDKDSVAFFYGFNEENITHQDWREYEIEALVPRDADNVKYGLVIKGYGKAFIDDVTFDVLQPPGTKLSKGKELTNRELENLKALANTYIPARFFNPTTEADFASWEPLMLYASKKVLEANNDKELKDHLNNIFHPVMPASAFYLKNRNNPEDYKYPKPENATDDAAVTFVNVGTFTERGNDYFESGVQNVYIPFRMREAAVMQMKPVTEKAEKVRFTARVKVESKSPASGAQIWLRGDISETETAFTSRNDIIPLKNDEWEQYKIEQDLPADVTGLRMGLVLIGDGTAWFDDVKVELLDSEGNLKNTLVSEGFEVNEINSKPVDWYIPETVEQAGYDVFITAQALDGQRAMKIKSDNEGFVNLPEIGKMYNFSINDSIALVNPLVYYSDGTITLPAYYSLPDYAMEDKPYGFFYTAEDFHSRLALVVMTWAYLKQFNIEDISPDVFNESLESALNKAATANSREEMIDIIKELVVITEDSQAKVWQGYDEPRFCIPFLMATEEDKVIITHHHPKYTEVESGDEVIEIDGKAISEYFKSVENTIPAKFPHYMKARALAEIRVGEEGSDVEMKIMKKSGKQIELKVPRDYRVDEVVEPRYQVVAEIDTTTLYVDMTGIGDMEFREYIPILEKYENVIFDLRGLAKMSEHVNGLFLSEPVKSIRWETPVYTGPFDEFISQRVIDGTINAYDRFKDRNLIFLSNERSIGYSEAILHVVKDNNLGTIIGRNTAGTAGEIIPYRLPGDYHITKTCMKGISPSGKNLLKSYVKPDYYVNYNKVDLVNTKDIILEEAIKYLKMRK